MTSLDEKTKLPRFVDQLTSLTDYAEILDQDVLEQFRGYKPYQDKEQPEYEAAALSRFPRITDAPQTFAELPEYAQEYWRWVQENRPPEVQRGIRGGRFPGAGPYPGLDRARGVAGPMGPGF